MPRVAKKIRSIVTVDLVGMPTRAIACPMKSDKLASSIAEMIRQKRTVLIEDDAEASHLFPYEQVKSIKVQRHRD